MNKNSALKFTAFTLAFACVHIAGFAYATEPPDTTVNSEQVLKNLSPEQVKKVEAARNAQASKGYDEKQQEAIDLAIEAVNLQTPVDKDTVNNLKIRAVQWPDSSLGCPSPDQQYMQVVVPGYQINFSADGKDYSVSTGNGRAVVCDQLADFMSARRERGQAIMLTQRAAKTDLAAKLMVDIEQIKVSKMKLETFADSRLGCEESEAPELRVPVDGLIIHMSCRDRQYEYRAVLGETRFITCKAIESCHETE